MSRIRVTPSGRLARLGFDVDAAIRDWDQIGVAADALLLRLAEAADPDRAIRSLARLVDAAGDEREPLRQALASDADLGRRLCLVLGASTALGDHLVRHPEDWRELADPSFDAVRPAANALKEALAPAHDRDSLRVLYRRHLLRLAARDLSLGLRVDDVAAELSDLAAAAIESALAMAYAEVGGSVDECKLSVIAMGKCGARELNYVSDVDVIFVAEQVDGVGEDIALRAATRVAGAMMRVCSDHTREGTLWPVDAGLRPEGKSGPLVRTLASHQVYYGRWAKTWEFQALLKARPIAGDEELGQRYMSVIAPLVWSAAGRPDFVSDVQAMRRRVVDQIPANQLDRQLKLGPGGLRDVEFAVQLLQLVHGRSDESLRVVDTLSALKALTDGGYVGREDGAGLADAYRFLRTMEHRLQLSNLRRTHIVPTDEAELRCLGRSLGFSAHPVKALTDEWKRHVREVRRLHEKLFYRPLLSAVAQLGGEENRLTTGAARDRLAALGYVDPAAALRHLEALTSGVSRRAAIQRTLLPVMLGWFAEAPDPDAGLLGFRQVSDSLGSTHWYLRMLRDEDAVAERLARLLATSRYATDLLMRAPEVTSLLGSDEELRPRGRAALVSEARAAASRQDDPILAVQAVRAVRRRELFRTAAADLFDLVEIDDVGQALSDVCAATLEGGLAAAVAAIEAERRDPLPTRIAVIAMGRLGGHEMGYSSDADVLFVHDPVPGTDEQDATDAAQSVANELRRLLGLPGPDPAMPVDTDLRPEGRQGPLVRTLASYAAYYSRWSKMWEAQALLRCEPIAGDRELGQRFVELIDPLRYPAEGLTAEQVAEIRRIKARVDSERLPRGADPATHVKLGRGGLADIEWTLQLLQLRYAAQVPDLRTTETLAAMQAAVEVGLLEQEDKDTLREAWRLASRIRNATMLVRARPSDSLPVQPRDRAGVAYVCGYPVGQSSSLIDDYLRISRRTKAVVDKVFWS